jgi:predicted unusual protein kinase regulating ubiquinone biosynthesis (AarF/ABC1/UbiB family)
LKASTAKGSKPAKPYTAYRWARENYSRWGRLFDIWRFVLTWLFYLWLDQQAWSYGGQPTPERKAKRRRARAIWIRETLLHLGPTFIKVGQFFSTRADLFPSEYVEELSKLQDQVPAFGYEQVAAIVQQELGKPIEQIYSYFDPTPLAAASLGQVHRAKLKSGEEVVVKVQRPGLVRLFTIDLEIGRGIAKFFQHHTPWGGAGRDWIGIYEECRRTLWEEVDYLNEGRNADTFRRNFRDMPQIAVPKVYWRYTSPRLLTLEYLPGIKISDYEALSAAGIGSQGFGPLGGGGLSAATAQGRLFPRRSPPWQYCRQARWHADLLRLRYDGAPSPRHQGKTGRYAGSGGGQRMPSRWWPCWWSWVF